MYPHPFDAEYTVFTQLTKRELSIRHASCAFREQPDWTSKILDRAYVSQWLYDRQQQIFGNAGCPTGWDRDDITYWYQEMLGYRNYMVELQRWGVNIEPDADCVWRAADILDDDARKQLIEVASILKDSLPKTTRRTEHILPESAKVEYLIDPSLYPLINPKLHQHGNSIDYSAFRDARDIEEKDTPDTYCPAFCWIPTEFTVSQDGKSTMIREYINNLWNPRWRNTLYPLIESVFTKMVPLFDHVLADLDCRSFQRRRCEEMNWKHHPHRDYYVYKLRDGAEKELHISYDLYYTAFQALLRQFRKGFERENMVDISSLATVYSEEEEEKENIEENSGEYYKYEHKDKRRREKEQHDRIYGDRDDLDNDETKKDDYSNVTIMDTWLCNPMVGVKVFTKMEGGSMWTPPPVYATKVLEGRTVKVIVKMLDLVVDPQVGQYFTKKWEADGMMNERIVATGIYCYSQENVVDPVLSFQHSFKKVCDYKGFKSSNFKETIGWTFVKENTGVVYPNIFQHRFQPIKLLDETKEGRVKLLIFHLCDPESPHEIPTTSTLAPQQPEFFFDSLRKLGRLGQLPEEIFSSITPYLEPHITFGMAELMREELHLGRMKRVRKLLKH